MIYHSKKWGTRGTYGEHGFPPQTHVNTGFGEPGNMGNTKHMHVIEKILFYIHNQLYTLKKIFPYMENRINLFPSSP